MGNCGIYENTLYCDAWPHCAGPIEGSKYFKCCKVPIDPKLPPNEFCVKQPDAIDYFHGFLYRMFPVRWMPLTLGSLILMMYYGLTGTVLMFVNQAMCNRSSWMFVLFLGITLLTLLDGATMRKKVKR